MRELPDHIAALMAPCPDTFTASMDLTRGGHALRWAQVVEGPAGAIEVEYGALLPTNDAASMKAAAEDVRRTAWQCLELARIGRVDYLAPVRADRHTQRPGAGRPLTAEAYELLANVKRAHDEREAEKAEKPWKSAP